MRMQSPMRRCAAVASLLVIRHPSCHTSHSMPRRVFCSRVPPGKCTVGAISAVELSTVRRFAVGGLAGVISALTGAGGGLVLIPALAKLTTMTQQTINGTQHGAVALGVLLGTHDHVQSGTCNVPLALLATLPSVAFARVGVLMAQRLSSKRLSLVVGSVMLATAPLLMLKNTAYFPTFRAATTTTHPLDLQFYCLPNSSDVAVSVESYGARAWSSMPAFVCANAQYMIAGSVAGFIAGLCGTGGGILMTAYLTTACDMPQELVIGTSLLAVLPMASSSALFSIRANAIHLPTAWRVGLGLGAGMYVTSKYITHHVPDSVLRGLLALTLGASALITMRRGL